MKKIFLLPILMLFVFSACETEDSLDPLPTKENGQFVKLDITKRRLSFDHQESAVFGGMLTTPGDKVVRYELFVRRTNASGITAGNYVPLLTVESFPTDLSITPQMIADALGVPVTDLGAGEVYRFLGYSYASDGTKIGYNNLSSTVRTAPGYKQGYKFMTDYVTDAYLTEDLLFTFNNYQL